MSSLEIAVLGLRVRFESDGADLLANALTTYDAWRTIAPASPAQVTVRLERGVTPPHGDAFDVVLNEPRISFASRDIVGEADASAGVGRCIVGIGADAASITEALDTIVLFLLTAHARVPLHAAGILFGETLALLAGPSGSGKSTLAAAALERGLGVFSDDVVYVDPKAPAFWGFPRSVHLLSEGDDQRSLRRGKWKRAVSHPELMMTGPVIRAALFLLERGKGVEVSEITLDDACATLLATLDPGFDRFREQLPGVITAITGGAWRLQLSDDPAEALDVIEATLAQNQ